MESICGIHNINAHTFLLICNIYTYDNYVPTREHMEKADMRGIMRYLHNSHSYYLDYEMVTLGESIDKVTASCDDRQKDIIKRFFAEYKEEVISHFEYEEQTLFPYIESMLSGKRRKNYSIGRFEKNHSYPVQLSADTHLLLGTRPRPSHEHRKQRACTDGRII